LVVYLEAWWDAKTFPLAFLPELGEVGSFPKEVCAGTFQILYVLWSTSYFAASCGAARLGIIKQYLEQQKTPL
jgi:hypothetical protein